MGMGKGIMWDRVQAVTVDGLASGSMVLDLAAGRPVRLVSFPGIAGLAGAGWWAGLCAEWNQRATGPYQAILDCTDLPGQVMSALRAGVKDIAFAAGADAAPGLSDRLSSLAAAYGARVLAPPEPVLQPCWRRNRDATLRQWLTQSLDFRGM